MNTDSRFAQEAGREVFTGSELLVKGAFETEGGVHLLTGYPGPPISDLFDVLRRLGPLLVRHGVVARLAHNEAVSVAMVNGAQIARCRAMAAVSARGLRAAGDSLALGVWRGAGPGAGGVVVCGDDPWGRVTQAPADSRLLAQSVGMPIMEPSNAQEVKDWVNLAFKISLCAQTLIGYRVTCDLVHGGGSVECRPNRFPATSEHQREILSPTKRDSQMVLDRSGASHGRGDLDHDQRFEAVKAEARRLGINTVLHQPQKGEVVAMGVVASGAAYAHLNHALVELGLAGRLPVLKLGLSYPLDENLVTEFARQCATIVVIEEGAGFVENQLVQILSSISQRGALDVQVYGKRFPGDASGIPTVGGVNPSILIERFVPLVKGLLAIPDKLTHDQMAVELERIQRTSAFEVDIADRPPTFCPGCPHRDSSGVLRDLRRDLRDPQYMLEHHKRKPVDLMVYGDSGCLTLLDSDPDKPLMGIHAGPGLGGVAASGVDPFVEHKQVILLGDGAFFQGGQTAISHAIQVQQDVTYIVLDNQTTAMAGQLPNPGVGYDLTGQVTAAQDIERIVRAMVPKERAQTVSMIRINPADHQRYRRLLEQTILSNGLKVVIADKECGVTRQRRVSAQEDRVVQGQGFLPRKTFMNVASEVCDYCLECTTKTGCPSLTTVDTAYGPKVQTDLSSCVNDGACQRVDACPSFEQVTVIRKQPSRQGEPQVSIAGLPDAPRPIHADQKTWRCYLAGIGGMGVGVCLRILAEAGHKMGYHVQFMQQRGVAVRTGGVSCQLAYTRSEVVQAAPTQTVQVARAGDTTTAAIPYGKADLILGIEMLEAARGLDPKHTDRVATPDHTAAVINTAQPRTMRTLMGLDHISGRSVEAILRKYTRPKCFFGYDVSQVSERLLGSTRYINTMTLGIAYQLGYLPVTLEAIQWAIGRVVGHDTHRNLQAFAMGRKIVAEPAQFDVEGSPPRETALKAIRRKSNALRCRYGTGRRGRRRVRQFRLLLKQTFRATRGYHLDEQLMRDVVVRTYDCFIWGGIGYAKRYCHRLTRILSKDDSTAGYAMTSAVVWNLAKVMLIKDELYVAALLTSPEKAKSDRRRFNVNPKDGDRIIYRYFHRPEFKILGRHIGFEWSSRRWQLRLMSRMRFLRDLLPGWHHRERAFRDWYEHLLDRFDWEPSKGQRDYQRWLAVLSVPQSVTGYRSVRYPKMEAARQRAEQLLATDSQLFEPEGVVLAHHGPSAETIRLPVLAGVSR